MRYLAVLFLIMVLTPVSVCLWLIDAEGNERLRRRKKHRRQRQRR